MTARIYLDHNATAPLRPAARTAMVDALALTGNASSIHAEGRAARAAVETARRAVANLLGVDARGVIFTASATEAANLVLSPGLRAPGRAPPARLLLGATEHSCMLSGHRFETAEVVPVGPNGVINLARLTVTAGQGPAMLALQLANNETGVIQPVAEAAAILRAAGGILVCDAVQGVGRLPVRMAELGVDAMILSSHKIGGPKGAAALVLADPDSVLRSPLIRGGGQERGARAGTEDVAAIAGFGAAVIEVARTGVAEAAIARGLRDAMEAGLRARILEIRIFGAEADRLPNTTCFAAPGIAAATLLMALDLAGVAVSAGSACSSGKIGPSHVLDAMGAPPHIAGSAIRVSVGWTTSEADVTGFLEALDRTLAVIRRTGRAA